MNSIEMPSNEQSEANPALRELHERLGPAIRSRCFYLLRDQAAADDALQEVFARASQHLALFQKEPSPLTALLLLATRHCLNVIRGTKAGWQAEQQRIATLRPAKETGRLEGSELVRAALGAVDLETQAAAIHFYVDELTVEDLSSILGCPVPELRKRLTAFAAAARDHGKPARAGVAPGAEEAPLAIPGTRVDACSRLAMRRLRAGELPSDEAARVGSHVSGCERCKATDMELEAELEAFRRDADFSRVADAIRRKHTDQQRRRWAGPVSLLIAAGLTTLILGGPIRQLASSSSRAAATRPSDAALELHGPGLDDATMPRLIRDGDPLAPGEPIRIGYRTSGKGFLMVLSIDQSGEVIPLHPASGERSAPVSPGAPQPAGELTPAGSGAHRIVALFSEEPLRIADAIEAARLEWGRAESVEAMGPLPLPATQSSRVLGSP